MELFSEIYSSYFTAIRKVMEMSQKESLSFEQIAGIINKAAFADSSFCIMPVLRSGEWDLESGMVSDKFKIPLTALQKSWLKAILADKRMKLFLNEAEIENMNELLYDVEPLYENRMFHYFDTASDGDPFDDEWYIRNFRAVLSAVKRKCIVKIEYDSGKGKKTANEYVPVRLNYSRRDDKFRLVAVSAGANRKKAVLNLARITSVSDSEKIINNFRDCEAELETTNNSSVVLSVLKDRNALERLMVQFAWAEKYTEYDAASDSYKCRIFYDSQDETELIIRILSFGPVVKVLEPNSFVSQIRERVNRQEMLNKLSDPL